MHRFVVPLREGFRQFVASQPRSLAFAVSASALVVGVVEKYLLEDRWEFIRDTNKKVGKDDLLVNFTVGDMSARGPISPIWVLKSYCWIIH